MHTLLRDRAFPRVAWRWSDAVEHRRGALQERIQ